MAEILKDKKIFSLLEVTLSIQKTIEERYTSAFWVKAEMNKLNHYSHSGHCYPELVEKRDGKVIAQLKANLWKTDYWRINTNFINLLHEPLKDGIKILFLAKISFDPVHGMALRILDIDPAFTLGDLEREKQETITRLKKSGLFEKNKTLSLPLLPQRIAIISVETSNGYADFLKVIQQNQWGYQFFHVLFPSLLQGERAVASIINQLNRIKTVQHHFDVVAIIRGGGGDVGLSCYNDYKLAEKVASFPLPVITGIGHATNETVVEMICFQNAITPTKIAEYLLQQFHDFSVPVHKAEEQLIDRSRRLINEEKARFNASAKYFRSVAQNILLNNKHELRKKATAVFQQADFLLKQEKNTQSLLMERFKKNTATFCLESNHKIRQVGAVLKKDVASKITQGRLLLHQHASKIGAASKFLFVSETKNLSGMQLKLNKNAAFFQKGCTGQLNNLEKSINNLNPENILKRGYSITMVNGKSVSSLDQIKKGDILDTQLYDGAVTSVVTSATADR